MRRRARWPTLVREIECRAFRARHDRSIRHAWEAAPYRPVPTIVEAATMLYRRHGVAEIAAARADVGNLTRTTDAIRAAIEQARARQQARCACSSPASPVPARRCAA